MRRKAALLLAAVLVLGNLTGCSRNSASEVPHGKTQGMETIGSALIQDSVTYVTIEGIPEPVSYIFEGRQKLSGDLGPKSMLPEDLLAGAVPAQKLRPLEAGAQSENMGPIQSSGNWDFFPEKVHFRSYGPDTQPQDSEWHAYFRDKLAELQSDSPVILWQSVSFTWGGLPAAIVIASNVISAECGDLLPAEEIKGLFRQPGNSEPSVYYFATLFVEGQPPMDLFSEYFEIPGADGASKTGFSYALWEEKEEFMKCLTSLQYNARGEYVEVPVFADMTGELSLRSFRSRPQWLVADVDGDGGSEIVFSVIAVSSSWSYYKVYGLEEGKVEERLSVRLN